jgi:hypothetical protein
VALRLVRQGDPEPFHIEETYAFFAIDWKGHYRIDGAAFVYTDRDTGLTTTVIGYPTDKLVRAENFKYVWLDFWFIDRLPMVR